MTDPITILLVDDDADDREMFIECVKSIKPGIICVEADDGEMALEKLSSASDKLPDFIFLDLNMPRLNGAECLKVIKSSARYSCIPVILYTTSGMNDTIKKLGADHFVTKPMTYDEICKTLNQVLKKFGVDIKSDN